MIFDVYCNDEYYNEYPSHTKVDITIELINRIFELKAALKKVGADKIVIYDCTPEYCDEKEKEVDCCTDLNEMVVFTSGGARWEAYIKNTNIKIYTQEISFIELAEIRKILTTPEDELPLLIGNVKSEEAKTKLTERLSSNG